MSFIADGDSINYGYGLADPATQCTWAQLFALAPIPGIGTFFNFATPGAVLYSGATSPLVSVMDRYAGSVKPHRPAGTGGDGGAVAILFNNDGINDLSFNRTADQLLADMRAYSARAKADGFTTWRATLLPTGYPGLEQRRIAVNKGILSGQSGADIIFDTAQIIPDPFDISVYQAADHVHPTLSGHTLRATSMAAQIASGAPVFSDVVFSAGIAAAAAGVPSELVNYLCPRINRSGSFDCITGRFTAPRSGNLEVLFSGLNNAGVGQTKVEIRKNGNPIGNAAFAMTDYGTMVASAITNVNAGDIVSVWITMGAILPSGSQTIFSGRML